MDTLATVVFRSSAIPEKPGKYISIENGPSAVREPKIRINWKYFNLDLGVFVLKITFLNFLQR
jgi:hypothetical protein